MFYGVSRLAFPFGETGRKAKGYGFDKTNEIMETMSIHCGLWL